MPLGQKGNFWYAPLVEHVFLPHLIRNLALLLHFSTIVLSLPGVPEIPRLHGFLNWEQEKGQVFP